MLRQFAKTPFIFLLIFMLAATATAQSGRSQRTATRSSEPAARSSEVTSAEPWLVTVIHQINVDELRKSLAQRGIEFKVWVNGQSTEYHPINITTGIAFDEQGHVLTRLVNIDPEAEPEKNGVITVMLANGKQYPARFVGLDGPTGFCILDVDGLDVPPAQLANNFTLEAGDNVTLVNVEFRSDANGLRNSLQNRQQSQLNRTQNSLQSRAQGKANPFAWLNIDLLSQTGKIVQFFKRAFFNIKLDNMLQTNSYLNLGAVLNNKKEVVGIPENGQANLVQVFSAMEARRAAERILAKGGNVPRGWLGVDGRDYLEVNTNPKAVGSTLMPKQRGVRVNAVVPNSPAEKFGLKQGDIITKVNGEPVEVADTLSSYVALQPAGEELKFTLLRDNKEENVTVKLGERGYAAVIISNSPNDPAAEYRKELFIRQLGVIEKSLADVQKQLGVLNAKATTNNTLSAEEQQQKEQLQKTQKELEERKKVIDRRLNPVRAVVKQGIEKSWLGIDVEDVYTPKPEDYDVNNISKPTPQGVRITSIQPDSIAAKGGLQVNDVILQTQNYLVANRGKLTDALSVLYHFSSNTMDVNIVRGTEKMTIRLDLERKARKNSLNGR